MQEFTYVYIFSEFIQKFVLIVSIHVFGIWQVMCSMRLGHMVTAGDRFVPCLSGYLCRARAPTRQRKDWTTPAGIS